MHVLTYWWRHQLATMTGDKADGWRPIPQAPRHTNHDFVVFATPRATAQLLKKETEGSRWEETFVRVHLSTSFIFFRFACGWHSDKGSMLPGIPREIRLTVKISGRSDHAGSCTAMHLVIFDGLVRLTEIWYGSCLHRHLGWRQHNQIC